MTTKTYCDFCGKEVLHMDRYSGKEGKDICPSCMAWRCKDMAIAIERSDLAFMNADMVKFAYVNLTDIIVRLNLQDELEKVKGMALTKSICEHKVDYEKLKNAKLEFSGDKR